MFGAVLDREFRGAVLGCISMESFYGTDPLPLQATVPRTWINMWFLRETWRNFPGLHKAGKLLTPILEVQTSSFWIKRLVHGGDSMAYLHVVNGFTVFTTDSEGTLNMEPGTKMPWPSNPAQLVRLYRMIWARESKRAWELGMNPQDIRQDHGYEELTDLMRNAGSESE
jgi:hypothetical protein